MPLKISGGPFKFPGRLNLTYLTAQTTLVRVVTPRVNKLSIAVRFDARGGGGGDSIYKKGRDARREF